MTDPLGSSSPRSRGALSIRRKKDKKECEEASGNRPEHGDQQSPKQRSGLPDEKQNVNNKQSKRSNPTKEMFSESARVFQLRRSDFGESSEKLTASESLDIKELDKLESQISKLVTRGDRHILMMDSDIVDADDMSSSMTELDRHNEDEASAQKSPMSGNGHKKPKPGIDNDSSGDSDNIYEISKKSLKGTQPENDPANDELESPSVESRRTVFQNMAKDNEGSGPFQGSELSKETEDTLNSYYTQSEEDVDRAKTALKNLKSGYAIDGTEQTAKSSSGTDDSGNGAQISPSTLAKLSPFDASSPMIIGERIIRVFMLNSECMGDFKISKETSFKDLRYMVQLKTGNVNWQFQDYTTKRPIQDESKRRVIAYGTQVVVAKVGLDSLIADCTIHGRPTLGFSSDGSCAFRVLWWDQKFHTSRRVWLKFSPLQISVIGVGGSFKLFDLKTMRVPLIFSSVKNSQLAFQFMKGRGNLASRFYASSLEQKKTIGIYFCFVWKPMALRRGLIPLKPEISMQDMTDDDDPRQFANLLRKHVSEMDGIIRDVERTMDPRVVRKYVYFLASIIAGGSVFGSSADGSSNYMIPTIDAIKQRVRRYAGETQDDTPYLDDDLDIRSGDSYEKGANRLAEAREKLGLGESEVPSGIEGPDGIISDAGAPAPPPLPPLNQLKQKQAICPVNFDGISTIDIEGTIWSEMDVLELKAEEGRWLERQLYLIFGRHSRSNTLAEKEIKDGVLESNRLRNVEVLMYMEEMKHDSIDDIIDRILIFDETIFTPQVLERLVRMVDSGGTEGKVYAFLPSAKESELLLSHDRTNKNKGKVPLRKGEELFLQMTKRIPDLYERFEFGCWISKFQLEKEQIPEALEIIEHATHKIRNSEQLKLTLRVILEILNTLMPRFGLTKGFKVSTFCSAVERVTGSVYISQKDGNAEQMQAEGTPERSRRDLEEERRIEAIEDEMARRRARRLFELRRGVSHRKDEELRLFWQVRLPEFMSIYLSKFSSCQGFWEDILESCQEAMKIDQALLDTQTMQWVNQIEQVQAWYDEFFANKKKKIEPDGQDQENVLETEETPKYRGAPLRLKYGASDGFVACVESFLSQNKWIIDTRKRVVMSRNLTEELWSWMGERMEAEPQRIFKYIFDFSCSFKSQWNKIYAEWSHIRVKAMRGVIRCRVLPKNKNAQGDDEMEQKDGEEKGPPGPGAPQRTVSQSIANRVQSLEKKNDHADDAGSNEAQLGPKKGPKDEESIDNGPSTEAGSLGASTDEQAPIERIKSAIDEAEDPLNSVA